MTEVRSEGPGADRGGLVCCSRQRILGSCLLFQRAPRVRKGLLHALRFVLALLGAPSASAVRKLRELCVCCLQFWVSQGQHWCEYCRVWMAKNVATIRHHEMGQGHKAAVAAKLKKLQHDASAQERERRQAEATMGHIEEV